MDAIGAELRQERERRGLTLEQLSESTNITVQNLVSMEEDRFDSFPNRVYARAFLRDYANYLGLDSAALLARYEQGRIEVSEPIKVPVSPRRSWRVVGYAALIILVLAGLTGVVYVGWRLHAESVEITVADAPRPPAEHLIKAESTPPSTPPVQPTPEPTPAPAPAQPDKLTLKLNTLGTVWVDLKIDGQTALYANIPKWTNKTFEAKRVIRIRVGKANQVNLELNGKPVVLGTKSVAVTRIFKLPPPIAEGR